MIRKKAQWGEATKKTVSCRICTMEQQNDFKILQWKSGNMLCDFILRNEFVAGLTQSPVYHDHSLYELYAVAEGEMRITVEEQEILLRAGDACVIPPGRYHYVFLDESSKRYGFCFRFYPAENEKEDGMLRQFFSAFATEGTARVFPSSYLYEPFLEQAASYMDSATESVAASFLFMALLKLSTEYADIREEQQQYQSDTRIRVIIEDYINCHYVEHIELSALAQKLNFSNRHTERQIQRIFHTTLTELVNRKRLAISKFMLKKSDKSLEEITSFTGFCDKSYLHRKFKKAFGQTPAEYRAAQKENP